MEFSPDLDVRTTVTPGLTMVHWSTPQLFVQSYALLLAVASLAWHPLGKLSCFWIRWDKCKYLYESWHFICQTGPKFGDRCLFFNTRDLLVSNSMYNTHMIRQTVIFNFPHKNYIQKVCSQSIRYSSLLLTTLLVI